ncbi:protein patched isoform X2 [Halyomorpha halys]|uniref:protein patched isoform X2 n=1 Tax=Halyomorpha halys TaxID=286706 RepID=UPI0006D51C00
MLADRASDVYVRTAWGHAEIALAQINKGKAEGSRTAIWVRSRIQAELFHLGCLLHCHPGKVIFVAALLLASFSVGLKSAVFHTKIEQLWIEEGGNVERELRYRQMALGEDSLDTHQLLIQTGKSPESSVLHPASLLKHVEIVKVAVQHSIQLFDVTWKLKDMCYTPSIPNFDLHYIDQIFENIIPCAIITPLDCFWEGSKLLGPDYPVTIPFSGELGSKVRWTNLNPQKILETMKNLDTGFPYETLEQHMKRAGITTGYQEKPCLNPRDEECPDTAPNKQSAQEPNVGAELTGGCYGFAANYMHWPEELIVGGVKKNKTGHIQRAHALQTVVQLMSEKELYEFWSESYKVHSMDWSQEAAAVVLDTWQRTFSQEVHRLMMKDNDTSPYKVFSFSTATLNDILQQCSQLRFFKISIGYIIMALYAAVSLFRWNDPLRSHCSLGIAGVILVSATVSAGLGFCAVLGIAFNASTTQIVPFLALGLGVDDVFLLTNTYLQQATNNTPAEEQTGLLLKKTGLSVLLTSLSNMCAMFAAAIIPIPALRVFSLQSAVLVLFNLASVLLVFPAIISLDLRRKNYGKYDIFCCLPAPGIISHEPVQRKSATKLQTIARALPPDRQQTVTVLAPPKKQNVDINHPKRVLNGDNPEKNPKNNDAKTSQSFLNLIAKAYAKLISKHGVKVFSVMVYLMVLCASVWGTMKVNDGLDLTDIVPQNTNEYAFLNAQGKYFGFYNMYAVTQGDFEYPTNQRLLYEYHDAFMRVQNIIKNDDGGLPKFWLGLFRDWLIGLQKAFDRDWKRGSINQERWFPNASDEGILAYKLLVQTGHVDNPIDKSLVTQVKLVDSEGIINPKAFYNYLSAWVSNDAFAYGASQSNLHPTPKEWFHVANDFDLKIPKSAPLIYAQQPFYLHGLSDTGTITKMITQVREICNRFEARGLPNFPSGIPFLFWEQYISLRKSLTIAVALALAAVFIVISLSLLNIRAAVLITFVIAGMILQLFGIIGALDIKLSAIPAVILIIAVGFGVSYTINLSLSFITSIGNKDRRTTMAVEHMFSFVTRGAITMALALVMLAFSEFDFIVKCFFHILLAFVGVGLINGLLFLPVILSLIGPEAEVRPLIHVNRISTPSPEPVKKIRQQSCRTGTTPPRRGTTNGQCHREPSLTTITEEPSWHSTTHEIVVEPEFVVETTTCNHTRPRANGSENSSCSQNSEPHPSSQPHITTKVTATAKLKVEVHTPIGSMDSYTKTCRSKTSNRDSSSSSDSDLGNRST